MLIWKLRPGPGVFADVDTVILEYVSSSCPFILVSVYLGGFSAANDVYTGYLTSFHKMSDEAYS